MEAYETAHYQRNGLHGPQDLQREAEANTRPGAGTGGGPVALPSALQYGAGAADHLVATRAGPLRQPLPAGSGGEKPPGDLPGICSSSQPRPPRRAGPPGPDLPGVLPSSPEWREAGLPALPGPRTLPLVHLQRV